MRLPLRLDKRVERFEDGRVLLDARAGRVLRLSDAGKAALERLSAGVVAGPGDEALRARLVGAGLAHPCPRPPAEPGGDLGAAVSVVVPVRDRPDALARCLAALSESGPPEIEVVVVDDASADAGATSAVCDRHGARLVRLARRRGPAGARNAGVEVAGGELVAFLDSDCRPTSGWLAPLVGLLVDEDLAAVAPRIRPAVDNAGVLARYAVARCPLDMGVEPGEVRRGGRISYVPTAALLVRRRWMEGGFDESLRYGEDVDLVWRILDGGGRVRYEPSSVVVHDEPRTASSLLARRLRYGTSAGPLARRHPGALVPVVLPGWLAASLAGALVGFPEVPAALAAWSASSLAVVLAPRGIPRARALRLGATGVLEGAEAGGRVATMVAGPLLVALAASSRRARIAALGLVAGPPLRDWWRRRPGLDPLRFCVASVADDVAYGLGVWRGSLGARTLEPLLPRRPARARIRRSSPRRWRRWRR